MNSKALAAEEMDLDIAYTWDSLNNRSKERLQGTVNVAGQIARGREVGCGWSKSKPQQVGLLKLKLAGATSGRSQEEWRPLRCCVREWRSGGRV